MRELARDRSRLDQQALTVLPETSNSSRSERLLPTSRQPLFFGFWVGSASSEADMAMTSVATAACGALMIHSSGPASTCSELKKVRLTKQKRLSARSEPKKFRLTKQTRLSARSEPKKFVGLPPKPRPLLRGCRPKNDNRQGVLDVELLEAGLKRGSAKNKNQPLTTAASCT
jgi:hypothetical protein